MDNTQNSGPAEYLTKQNYGIISHEHCLLFVSVLKYFIPKAQ